MMLGKRPRPPMRRTTSMTEFTVDLPPSDPTPQSDSQTQQQECSKQEAVNRRYPVREGLDPRFLSTVSPRNHRRNSVDFVDTANFLKACGLCKRRLVPGRDIYMYRGDTGFCSLECRQQQMSQDERKEKCSLSRMKKEAPTIAGSDASTKGETVAAA